MAKTTRVRVGEHRLTVSNLDKVLYPATGTTKADVLRYYAEIGAVVIPHLTGRPVTQKRWPDGVDNEPFFQRNLRDATPDWVDRVDIEHEHRTVSYPLVDGPATLVWFGQNAALELHTPQWRITSDKSPGKPDRLVLDLDPGEGVSLAECAAVAIEARALLADHDLTAFPVTSGSKGIHLYCPLGGRRSSETITDLAHQVARTLQQRMPDTVLSVMKRSLRQGKVFVDWSQNSASKTTVAPYSLRGRERPTVAAPRSWQELEDPDLEQLDWQQVLDRISADGDLLEPLTRKADRLATYRSMRDASKTPEPVPDAIEAAGRDSDEDNHNNKDDGGADDGHDDGAANEHLPKGNDDTFVIQEHHATALHWDFRLEHDGVLVSWALPKGVPQTTKKNNLAIHTEDHPLDYAGFAGSIPKGQYGGGEVTIWDSGSYELEKWHDDEVIVILRGDRATGRYALFQTGGKNWMIHRTKDQPAASSKAASTKTAPPKAAPPKAASTKATGTGKVAAAPGPMMATLGTLDDVGDMEHWAFEMKWDGVRAIVHVHGGAAEVISRNGKDLTAEYPELQILTTAAIPDDTVLDGEIVAFGRNGAPDFGRLQRRMKLRNPAQIEATGVTVQLMLFDVLRLGGESLLRNDWTARRAALEELSLPTHTIQLPAVFRGDGEQAIETSAQHHLEGVVAKRRDSSYTPGRRSRRWIKIKHQRTQEVVVVGWRPGSGRRSGGVGSLLVAVNDDGGTLRYVGGVGTGFSDADLVDLADRFAKIGRKRSPVADSVPSADARTAHWLRPTLVGEVTYANWTTDGRLRQPVWRGFRPDKQAGDVIAEQS